MPELEAIRYCGQRRKRSVTSSIHTQSLTLSMFGDKNAGSIVLLKTYNDYYNGFNHDGECKPGYAELITELMERFPLGEPVIGKENQKDIIRLYGAILRLKNILTAFDDFAGNEILNNMD